MTESTKGNKCDNCGGFEFYLVKMIVYNEETSLNEDSQYCLYCFQRRMSKSGY